MGIATLTIDINARLASIEKDMGRAAQIAEANAKRMADAFDKVGAAFAAVGGAAAVAALGAIVKSTADAADSLGKLAQKTGIAVENLSKLQYAASLSDVSNDDLATSLARLARSMADTAQGTGSAKTAFEALGINVKTASGELKSTDAVFAEIAGKFAKFKDSAEKAAVAQDLFGKSGANLIPLLNAGADGLSDLGAEAERFGAVISGDLAKASEQFNDNLTRLAAQADGARIVIGNALIPVLAEATDGMVAFGGANGAAEVAAAAFRTVLETVVVLGANVAYVFNATGKEIGGIAAQAAALARFDFAGAAEIGRMMKSDAAAARAEIDAFSERILNAGKSVTATAKASSDAEKPTLSYASAVQKAGEKARAAGKEFDVLGEFIKDLERNEKESAKREEERARNISRTAEALEDRALAAEDELRNYGLTESQIQATTLARYEEVRATAAQNGATEEYLRTLDREINARRRIVAATGAIEARAASDSAAQAAADEWQRTADSIGQSLTDAIFNGGQDGWELLKKTIEATVIRAVILPVVQGGVQSVMQSVGLVPGGGTGGGSGGSGIGVPGSGSLVGDGLVSLGYSSALAGSSLGSFAAGAGAALTNGAGIAGNLSAAWSAAATGTSGGIATGIGMAAPYLAAALMLTQALGAFDGPSYHSGAAVGTGLDGAQTVLGHQQAFGDTQVWGGFSEVDAKGGGAYVEGLKTLGAAVEGAIESTLKSFGQASQVSVYSAFGADGEDASRGNLRVYDDEGNLVAANSELAKRGKKYSDDPAEGFKQFSADSGRVIRDALIAADLPAWVDSVLATLGASPTLDSLNATLKSVEDVKATAKLAAPALGLTAEGLASVIEASGNFGSTMNSIAAIVGTTVDANERWRMAQDALTKQFEAAGVLVPASTESFRAMLKGIDLTTDAGADLYSQLLNLAPAFWEVAGAVEATFAEISKSTAGMIESFKFDVMDQAEKYAFYDTRIDETLRQLAETVDPAKVLELFQSASSDLSASWGLLDDTEKKRLVGEFEDRAMTLEAASQSRLSVTPLNKPAPTPEQIAESVATAVARAIGDAMTAAADTMAKAGGDQVAAAELMAAAIAQIPGRIVVSVESPEVTGRPALWGR